MDESLDIEPQLMKSKTTLKDDITIEKEREELNDLAVDDDEKLTIPPKESEETSTDKNPVQALESTQEKPVDG